MEDIATEAVVGKGTLYRYFRDKDELYVALLERSARQITARLQESVLLVSGGRARLQMVVADIIGFFDEQPQLLDLIQRAEVMRGPNGPWQQTRDEVMKLTLHVFAEAREQGEFDIADEELAALMLLGGLRSVLRFGERPRPGDQAERIVDHFLNGHNRLVPERLNGLT